MSRAESNRKNAQKKRKPVKRPHRGDAQKAAVIALLLEGCTPTEIQKRLKVPESTARNYRRELTADQLTKLNEKRAGRLDDMIFEHLDANFTAMRAIAQHVQSPRYIQRQDADALAVLFGVINDKSVRILDALERARSPQADGTEES